MHPVWSLNRAPSKSSLSVLKKLRKTRKAEENKGDRCTQYPSTVLNPQPLGLWSRNVHWVCLSDRSKMAPEVFP